ncbi:MAG: Holliday junction resolvase RuvX [bacterium]|nr:Holliday junction resolvase RuvX [bacterium]
MSIPEQQPLNLLAIDYGKRRVGLAVCSAGSTIAFGLTTLTIKGFNDLIAQLKPILDERQVQRVVVGIPLTLSDRPGTIIGDIVYLKQRLQNDGYPVELVDEALSSRRAMNLLNLRGRQSSKTDLDRTAAALILQEYLDGSLPPLSEQEIERYRSDNDHLK